MEFKDHKLNNFRDDGTQYFKLGTCPWKNYHCEYAVCLTYRDHIFSKWVDDFYCSMGSYVEMTDMCPIDPLNK